MCVSTVNMGKKRSFAAFDRACASRCALNDLKVDGRLWRSLREQLSWAKNGGLE